MWPSQLAISILALTNLKFAVIAVIRNPIRARHCVLFTSFEMSEIHSLFQIRSACCEYYQSSGIYLGFRHPLTPSCLEPSSMAGCPYWSCPLSSSYLLLWSMLFNPPCPLLYIIPKSHTVNLFFIHIILSVHAFFWNRILAVKLYKSSIVLKK